MNNKKIYEFVIKNKQHNKLYLAFKSGQDRFVLSNGRTYFKDEFLSKFDIINVLNKDNYTHYLDLVNDRIINRKKSTLVTKYNPNTGCLIRTYADDTRFEDVPNV